MLACASDLDGRSVEYLIKHKADTSLQDKKVNTIKPRKPISLFNLSFLITVETDLIDFIFSHRALTHYIMRQPQEIPTMP